MRLQATVPIYQNGSEWSAIRQAKELVGQRRNELDSARRAAARERHPRLAPARFVALARHLVQAQVRANEVALNGVRQEALVGSRTTLDVLNAEQELLNSQVSLIGPARRAGQLLRRAGRHRPADGPDARLPVEYYDEEKYYNEVGSRWIGGDWRPAAAPASTQGGGFGK